MIHKNKYYQRLYDEWKQHGKIIIAIDYDDTISPWKFNSKEDLLDLDKTIALIRTAQEIGAYLVIFTACNSDRYEEIREYCAKKGLKINAINETPLDLPYGKTNKIYANLFLDDRAGLLEALEMLEDIMYKIRAYKYSSINRDEIA